MLDACRIVHVKLAKMPPRPSEITWLDCNIRACKQPGHYSILPKGDPIRTQISHVRVVDFLADRILKNTRKWKKWGIEEEIHNA